jgi:hypothetical protein
LQTGIRRIVRYESSRIMTKNGDIFILDALKVDERKFGRAPFLRGRQAFATYTVRTTQSERRTGKRSAVRLQSGKVLDANGSFISDFLFVDRGAGGVRISLARRMALPKKIWLYDDLAQICRGADVAWQNHNIVGCRYRRWDAPLDERLLRRFRAKYYALS